MGTFMDLYRYECKKIWNKNLTKVSFIFCLVIGVIAGIIPLFGNHVVEGKVVSSVYDACLIDQSYEKALSGRAIDLPLLDEMVSAYRTIPENPDKHYTLTAEYQANARPYSSIFNFVLNTTDLLPSDIFSRWQPNEQNLYHMRLAWLQSSWKQNSLFQKELDFWEQKEAQIEKPVIYQEHEAYSRLFDTFQTIGFAAILFVSISLSSVFPEEHSRKTDQLVLSSVKGRRDLYWAKLAAGISYAAGAAASLFLVILTITFALFGTGGFDAAFQLYYCRSSDAVSCGQALLIACAIMLITVILISIVVMTLSELLRSNIAALAISSVLLIVPMFLSIPSYYRIPAQIYEWFPWTFLYIPFIFGQYTLSIAGLHLTPWQAVPIIYLISGTIIAALGSKIYHRYQVSGR